MSAVRLVLAASAMAAMIGASPPLAEASPELHVEGRHFKDARGGTVILRGVNVAGNAKVPPFRPAEDPAIFDPLKRWGMNVVRLLFTWEAYEPSPGVYDQGYLDYYAAAAQSAWDRGLFVIVDIHQDGFSRVMLGGCGDGFPAWAVPPSIPQAEPDNGPACEDWGLRLSTDADTHAAWAAFYADETGARTRYLAMVKSVAARLDAEPGVIGYDMLNEPWGDEAADIGPLYEDAATAIREASPTAILFVSPRTLTSSGEPTELTAPSFSNAAYSPHYYAPSVVLFKSWSGPQPDLVFDSMRGTAETWGAPLFLGEFGAPAETVNGDFYVESLYRHLDEGFSSGAQWVYTPGWTPEAKDGWNAEDFSIVDDSGATRPNFQPRPFPRRIAGTPLSLRVTPGAEPRESLLELEWDHDPKSGETEVFMPSEVFFRSAGVAIETTGEGLACSATGSLVKCSAPVAGKKHVILRAAPIAVAEPAGCRAAGPAGRSASGTANAMPLSLLMLLLARAARRSEARPVEVASGTREKVASP